MRHGRTGPCSRYNGPVPERYRQVYPSAGHHYAGRRVAADPSPGPEIVNPDNQKAGQSQNEGCVVTPVPACLLALAGRSDAAFRHFYDDGQTLTRTKPSGCLKADNVAAIAGAGAGTPPGGSISTREIGRVGCANAVRQKDFGARLPDGKVPEIAGDIPVQFVIIGKETYLPGRSDR